MAKKLMMVKTEQVDDSDNKMREDRLDDTFDELVSSIRRDGVLVPILLYGYGESFRVVAGHRRFRAATEIGLVEIPAYVDEDTTATGWSASFAENLFRRDLSPIELAAAIKDCVESEDFDVERIARMLGRSAAWVCGMITVASWPNELQEAVHHGGISLAAARNLALVEDPVHREMLVNYAVANGVTARITAAWLQAWVVGRTMASPGEVEPVPAGEKAPVIEPYTPCIICGRQQKMIELRYLPICNLCTDTVMDLSRNLAAGTRSDHNGG